MDFEHSSAADPDPTRAHLEMAQPVQANDISRAYAALLGRQPESEEAVADKVGMSRRQLILQFITSEEFEDKVVRPVLDHRLPSGPVFDHAPDPKMLAWAADFFPLSQRSRRAAGRSPNWVSLFETVFCDPEAAAVLKSEAPVFTPSRFCDQLAELKRSIGDRRVLGGLDEANGLVISGWALDAATPDAPVGVELWINGAFASAALAGDFRRDLQDRFSSSGAHGFVFKGFTPPSETGDRPVRIEVRESGSKMVLGSASIHYRPDRNSDRLAELTSEIKSARAALERIERSLAAMQGSFGFTLKSYDAYRRAYYVSTPQARESNRTEALAFARAPLVNVVLVERKQEPGRNKRSLESLREQTYSRFDILRVNDDGSQAGPLDAASSTALTPVSVSNPKDAQALADALGGDYVLTLNAGDWLSPDALHCLVRAVQGRDPVIVYADSDVVEGDLPGEETFSDPQLRPDFDLDLLLQTPYLGQTVLLASGPLMGVLKAGLSFSEADRGALILSLLKAQPDADVIHVNRVLHHRRLQEARPMPRYVQAVTTFLEAVAPGARALPHLDAHAATLAGCAKVIWPLPEGVTASVVIPTRDRLDLLGPCLASVIASRKTNIAALEIIVVDNASASAATKRFLHTLDLSGEIRLLDFDGPFNWSAINNHAARLLKSDVLIFLNNDTVVLTDDWADELCRQALRPEVGVVGARLLYEDRTIQHAGVVLGVGESKIAHEGAGLPLEDAGYLGRRSLVHRAAAVTGACLATRRTVFASLGGFDEDRLAVEGNDIDYCLRVRKTGFAVLYDPYCTLYHFESKSRGQTSMDAERLHQAQSQLAVLGRRWGADLLTDPYYNRHFDPASRPFTRLGPPPSLPGESL